MKNKKIMAVILLIVIMLTTGCGSNDYIKDETNNMVVNNETGQTLQKEIFCKPSKGTEMYNLYEQYSDQMTIPLDELDECSDFTIRKTKNDGIWSLIFVKPVAYLILKLGNLLNSWGFTKAYLAVSLIIIGILIRVLLLPLNIKTQNQSKNMQKIQPEMQRIEKKYAGRDDKESMMAKSQEMMMIYKKYKINPLLSCLLALIQLPIFFAFLRAIYKIPTIYEGELFGWNLGTTPSVGIMQNHQYSFIILVVLIILTTFFSFKYSMSQAPSATPESAKQTRTMLIVMTVMIGFASISLPTAIAIYWIATYAFVIAQTFIMKLITNRKSSYDKELKKESKRIQEKLKVKEGMKYGKNK